MERQAGAAVRTRQGGARGPRPPRGRGRGDRRPDGEQGAGPQGRGEGGQPTSTEDISSGRRGGLRSHRGPGGRTRDQLYEEAREKKVKGRSKMTKQQLERAVGR